MLTRQPPTQVLSFSEIQNQTSTSFPRYKSPRWYNLYGASPGTNEEDARQMQRGTKEARERTRDSLPSLDINTADVCDICQNAAMTRIDGAVE